MVCSFLSDEKIYNKNSLGMFPINLRYFPQCTGKYKVKITIVNYPPETMCNVRW